MLSSFFFLWIISISEPFYFPSNTSSISSNNSASTNIGTSLMTLFIIVSVPSQKHFTQLRPLYVLISRAFSTWHLNTLSIVIIPTSSYCDWLNSSNFLLNKLWILDNAICSCHHYHSNKTPFSSTAHRNNLKQLMNSARVLLSNPSPKAPRAWAAWECLKRFLLSLFTKPWFPTLLVFFVMLHQWNTGFIWVFCASQCYFIEGFQSCHFFGKCCDEKSRSYA